jgi:Transcriptional regulatory protein, C terminal
MTDVRPDDATAGPDGRREDAVAGTSTWAVGRWRLDVGTGELRHDGPPPESQRLEPKVAELLVYLARRPGQLLSREELLSAVWPGVVVELSDAHTARVLWSEHFDRQGGEVFAIQDSIVRNIVGALAVKVAKLESDRAATRPPRQREAYDLVLLARAQLARADRAANRQGRALVAQARALAPDYAMAYVVESELEEQRADLGWMEDPAQGLLHAERTAVLAHTGRLEEARQSLAEVRRLQPNFPLAEFGNRFADAAVRERVQAALRKAGL